MWMMWTRNLTVSKRNSRCWGPGGGEHDVHGVRQDADCRDLYCQDQDPDCEDPDPDCSGSGA